MIVRFSGIASTPFLCHLFIALLIKYSTSLGVADYIFEKIIPK